MTLYIWMCVALWHSASAFGGMHLMEKMDICSVQGEVIFAGIRSARPAYLLTLWRLGGKKEIRHLCI